MMERTAYASEQGPGKVKPRPRNLLAQVLHLEVEWRSSWHPGRVTPMVAFVSVPGLSFRRRFPPVFYHCSLV
jgi:hypothetical protein